ncbi:MAG: peptidoglycan bridge formation glycyltransferase FemA/FemB family protein [Phycisphaerae bacterium]|nr:peptidoglycan bridge formation glycyltransferase FemA/FemB family protein [Phycisphaerae bacterium]
MNPLRLIRIANSMFCENSIGELGKLFMRFLFRSDNVIVFMLDSDHFFAEDQENEKCGNVVKGGLYQLDMISQRLDPIPWEFRCYKYDGVKDFFVVKDAGEIQHISWVYFQNDPNRILKLEKADIEIKYCLTLPQHRGQGLYPKTLKAIAKYYLSRGYERIFISINADNSSSIRGAEKVGFRRIGKTCERKVLGIQLSRRVSFLQRMEYIVAVTTIGDEHRSYWDREVAMLEMCHPLNAFGWGKVRSADGWIPTYILAKRKSVVTGAAILLTKPIPFTPFSILYMPRGPVCSLSDRETIGAIIQKVKDLAKSNHAIFLRIDPNVLESSIANGKDPFAAVDFRHLSQRWTDWNAPRDVVRVNLEDKSTEDEFFLSMKKDVRRCIRKAGQEGVTVREAKDIRDLKAFYVLFTRFSEEKGFMSRGYEYQKSLWDQYIKRGNGVLLLAEYKGQMIGGSLCLMFGRKCLGMHGGVLLDYRRLNASELLEWESIKWAKEQGCIWYSFRGKGPTSSQLKFKMKFGSKVVPLIGYYDLPFYPFIYRILSWLEFIFLPRISAPLTKLYHIYRHFKP